MTVPRSTSICLAALATFALGALACGDGGAGQARDDGDAADTRDGTPSDGIPDGLDDLGPDVAADADEDAEIIYPGNPCGRDDQCSTGLCYGLANAQGAFESPRCQLICLDLNDFHRYCDSDDDCCKGRCCIGCGAREGLCVLD